MSECKKNKLYKILVPLKSDPKESNDLENAIRAYSGGGVLFYAYKNNESYLLLGKERCNRYDDFGGARDRGEKSPKLTAIRECNEESLEVVPITKNDLQFTCCMYKYAYFQFWVKIEFDEKYLKIFQKKRNEGEEKLEKVRKEKHNLKWVKVCEIRKALKNGKFKKRERSLKINEDVCLRKHLIKMMRYAEEKGILKELENSKKLKSFSFPLTNMDDNVK